MTKLKVKRVEREYFITENKIFELDIDKHAKLLYCALCRYADNNGQAFPSMRRLAKDCSVSKTTVDKYLKELVDKGLIEKLESDKKFNQYRIMDWIDFVGKSTVPADGIEDDIVPADSTTVPADGIETVPADGTKEDHNKKTYNKPLSDTQDNDGKWTAKDIEYKLTMHLSKLIDENHDYAKTPTNSSKDIQKWITPIDRLMRLDGAKAHHIRQTMDWCQQDDFWQVNILSTSKFRDKFPQLFSKAKKAGFITKSFEEQKKEHEDEDDVGIGQGLKIVEN